MSSSGTDRNSRRFIRGRNAPKPAAVAPLRKDKVGARASARSAAQTSPSSSSSSRSNNAKTADSPPPKHEVVGESPQQSQHPYTSISLSPSKKHAVTATNDTLQLVSISPAGLVPLPSFSCAPLFMAQTTPVGPTRARRGAAPNYNSYAMAHGSSAVGGGPSLTNVVINDVAWSKGNGEDFAANTWIAAGGSNGVIILWCTETLQRHLQKTASTSAAANKAPTPAPPPDAVLRQHIRAVNRIDWHPWDPATFLSASQDGTVRLWERKRKPKDGSVNTNANTNDTADPSDSGGGGGPTRLFQLPIFGGGLHMGGHQQDSFSWICTTSFEPKSEAVRDVAWNPFEPDVFALVTAGGTLVAYHRRVKIRSLVKLTAHGREASCLDWHPRLAHIVATGGATDGSVKVWNLSKQLDPEQWTAVKPGTSGGHAGTLNAISQTNGNMTANFASISSRADSIQTDASDTTDRSSPSFLQNRQFGTVLSAGGPSLGSRAVHVLSVAASVTRVRWRPSAGESFVPVVGATENKYFDDDWSDDRTDHPLQSDRHDALLAVSTAPVGGWVGTGGAGNVGLWSCHRPFMALSVVEGHMEGAVVDFVWLETPIDKRAGMPSTMSGRLVTNTPPTANAFDRNDRKTDDNGSFRSYTTTSHRNEDGVDSSEHSTTWLEPQNTVVGIWQHVLSVGKDGRCLVQSLMRGDRPLSRVPPSCFAMANLSPFQQGYGSLQLFTVCQPVPSGPRHDYLLTGLRRDNVTAEAPGMFREAPTQDEVPASNERAATSSSQWSAARRLPPRDPIMGFSVLDQGDLDSEDLPLTDQPEAITVAPEVVHMSRFAGSYLLRPTEHYPTSASLCLHNSEVANDLNYHEVAHLWATLGSMLAGSGLNGLDDDLNGASNNVLQFLVLPTVKSMVEEFAEQGDVQTCVAICEVLEVLNGDGTTKIQNLDINRVREWYCSYIDMLRDMCLFSYASEIIQRCVDPYIADQNKTSTTIQESCPYCRKPMLQEADSTTNASARRTCKNCRRRIGMCFLCHQPVQGVYVWCPGCGHGGHLEHALSWFGGLSGKAVRELW